MKQRTALRVSDEVWRSAPRRRLPRVRVMTAVIAFAVLLVAFVAAWQRGLVVPQLQLQESGSAATAGSARFDYRFFLLNRGSTDVTLTGISTGAPWLTVASVTRPEDWTQGAGALGDGRPLLPLVVPPSTGEEIRIVLEVDCAARDTSAVPLLIDVDGFARSHTVPLQPEPGTPRWSGGELPEGITRDTVLPWPQQMMDWVCNPYRGDDAENG